MRFLSSLLLFLGLLLASLPAPAQLAPEDLFQLTSPDFGNGGRLPKKFTQDDENASPTLDIAGTPKNAQALVLIVDDPDAPSGTFTHWLVWNIPPGVKELVGKTVPQGTVGTNDFGKTVYSGPKPPSGEHRYYFRLYALDTRLHLPAGSARAAVERAMEGHVLGKAVLMGRYAHTASFQN